MAADISNLNLQASEALDLDSYPVAGAGKKFPPKGRYTLRATESFTSESFGESKAGALTIQIDPTIVGPIGEGRTLKYTRISAKTWKDTKTGKVRSQLGDYLKACGQSGSVSGNPQEQANAAEQTAGATFEAYLDWRLFAKGANPDGSDLVIEGMENFPQDPNGGHVPFIPSPTQTDPATGEAKRLWANLVIDGFIGRRS